MKLKNKIMLFTFIVFLSVFITVYIIFFTKNDYNLIFDINKGDSLSRILNKSGFGEIDRLGLKILFRINRTAGRIIPKSVEIKGNYTLSDIHNIIISPAKQEYFVFTILPGERWREVRDRMIIFSNGKNPADYYNIFLRKYSFLKEFGNFEGFIAPDTYYVNKASENPIMELLELGLDKFNKDFYQKYKEKNIIGMEFSDICKLASIVEKEGRFEEENRMIAGVFINRLQKNQALESCATVQYLFDKPKKRLYYKDTAISSPYNTYLNKGLPPGPICFFAESTLKAVYEFKKHDYYYFVLSENGKHHFSKTLEEHNRNK